MIPNPDLGDVASRVGRVLRGRSPRTRSDHGSAVVEFALVLPIVLLVLLALVQVGVLAADRLLLSQAARAGARQAAVDASDDAVVQVVRAAAPSLDPGRLDVAVTRTGERGAPVTVAVRYEAGVAGVLAGWLLPASVEL